MIKNMKKIFFGITGILFICLVISSCHKIDVPVTSELTPSVFPITQAQFEEASGPVYIAVRNDYSGSYFFCEDASTDEAVLPTFGGNWLDGNKYVELHRHTWTQDNAWVNSLWTYCENIIGVSNQTLSIFNSAPTGSAKNTGIAEIKTMRAFAYFMLMDNYGNVPLDTLYGNTVLHTNTPRTQVFTWIESQLKAAIPYLPTATGTTTYGKPTQWFAYSLLAKMYLNAQVYTGTSRNDDCIAACDQVISSGSFGLEPMATYLQQFYPTNGPSMKEFIFAIPYDASVTSGYMFYARYDLNRNLGIKYSYSGSTAGSYVDPVLNQSTGNGLVNNQPSGPRMTTASYYAHFDDPNDIRNKQWLTGPQYWADGTPIMVYTTNLGYNQFYTGSNPSGSYTYALNITPLVDNGSRNGATSFDLGNDEIAWNIGIRNIKFFPDYTNTISRNQNNDIPVFRYSDIILMKAEAILRGGTATLGATALSLINQIKAVRTTTPALASVTLNDIYNERCKEFAWESWHRNDMIRFGHYEDSWGLGKTNTDTYREIFPIPTIGFQSNPKLVQNTGY